MVKFVVAAMVLIGLSAPSRAETIGAGTINVELNSTASLEDSCTLTFVVQNGHADEIERLVFETVLFDRDGKVDRLTLFDFGNLPVGIPRVRQFSLPETHCERLGRILFNGLSTCDAANDNVCAGPITHHTRTDIEVLG
ncbi:MAG: hypothetical protein AAFV38_06400 [Pseudomonadota bacterium]